MNAIVPAFGCATEGIPFNVALAGVLGLVTEKPGTEDVPLAACVGRIIAAPFDARLDLPGFDQSAMDGYAVCCADLMSGACLEMTGRTAAGEAPGQLATASDQQIELAGEMARYISPRPGATHHPLTTHAAATWSILSSVHFDFATGPHSDVS